VAGTLSNAAQLAVKPQEAVKNPTTIADTVKTGGEILSLAKGAASVVVAPTPQPARVPPIKQVPFCKFILPA
jgi:hypothetical protein